MDNAAPSLGGYVSQPVQLISVTLFVLILVVCALFVANSATGAVRGRRQELGELAARPIMISNNKYAPSAFLPCSGAENMKCEVCFQIMKANQCR